MKLQVVRFQCGATCTIGELLVNGEHECWTLEDVVRPDGQKVFGEGASFICVRYDGCSVSVLAASFSQNNRHRHAVKIYYSFLLVFYLETVCAQDKLSRHHGRRHRDTTVTIAVGSTLGRRQRL